MYTEEGDNGMNKIMGGRERKGRQTSQGVFLAGEPLFEDNFIYIPMHVNDNIYPSLEEVYLTVRVYVQLLQSTYFEKQLIGLFFW